MTQNETTPLRQKKSDALLNDALLNDPFASKLKKDLYVFALR